MKSLDLKSFPLDGLALVEASAGTGKTYTLANLYLRYLLEKQFQVEQVLVVTFTEAATQELRDRIRQRIQALREVFEGAVASDDVLDALFTQSSDPAADLIRLRIAERQMDQCEIYTIHGFCQRLLQNHSMVLGSPLQQSLSEDLSVLQQQCAEGYWREQVIHLPEFALRYVRAKWQQPSVLLEQIKVLFQRRPQQVLPHIENASLSSWLDKLDSHQLWYERLWRESLAVIEDVSELVAASGLKNAKRKVEWLNKIRAWCEQGDSFDFPVDSKKANLFLAFTPERLHSECKKDATAPAHPWFNFLEAALDNIPTGLDEHFELCGYEQIRQRMDAAKRQQSLMGFDDLIQQVALGLSSSRSAVEVEALISRVRQQYEVALIDEFQDTDPAQYQIFSSLFTDAVVPVPSRMVLIGDPKQAIYSFRGGDMATYLRAKRDISEHPDGNVFTMATNWRSSPSMVNAVNAVFTSQESPFFNEQIPFVPVSAAREEKASSGAIKAALQLAYVPYSKELSKEQVEQRLMAFCVDEIARVLAAKEFKSSDIAILVRTGRDAETMKSGLAQVGIRASFEGRHSIYQTEEALSLYWLLQAAAEPGNTFLQRQCLAQAVMAYSDAVLFSLFSDPRQQARLAEQFEVLHQCWLKQGLLSMVRRALVDFQVLDRWRVQGQTLFSSDWERRLSNLNQLAEILQQQSRTVRGHQAMIRWLRERIQKPEEVNDQSRVRLESDDQLVQIVTIHKSKGLEYPLVFLPFMFSGRPAKEAVFYDDDGRLTVDLLNQDANLLRAEQERLEEDMRLLYVALTRSKYRCYLGFSNFVGRRGSALGLHNTAWGRLLRPNALEALDDSEIQHAIQSLQTRAPGLCELHTLDGELDLREARAASAANSCGANSEKDSGNFPATASSNIAARELSRTLVHHWKVQSFTGIMNESEKHQLHRNNLESGNSLQRVFSVLSSANDNFRQSISIFDFPKGSRAGTFLHTLFEGIALESGELIESLRYAYNDVPDYIQSVLSSAGLVDEASVRDWSAYLHEWMQMVIRSDLHEGLRLADIVKGDYLPELDFHFPAEAIDATRLNSLLARYRPDLPPLLFESFEGHVKGAIDLVFRHEGKFYVLDYKSNYLGDSAADYQLDSLQNAIDEHRYDLQYLLYTLAVHRHLSERLGEAYDYQRDFGGVIYLFLRGVENTSKNVQKNILSDGDTLRNGVYFCQPDAFLIQSLDQLFRREAIAAGAIEVDQEDRRNQGSEI